MATVQELAAAVAALKAQVEQFPGVIDTLEQKIRDALAQVGLTVEQQAAIDAAFADATSASASAQSALDDAANTDDQSAGGGGPV